MSTLKHMTQPVEKSDTSRGEIYVQDKENNSQSYELIERERVDTIFELISIKSENKKNSFIAIGNHRVTDMETKENLRARIDNKDWGLITSLITIIIKGMEEENKIFKVKN